MKLAPVKYQGFTIYIEKLGNKKYTGKVSGYGVTSYLGNGTFENKEVAVENAKYAIHGLADRRFR